MSGGTTEIWGGAWLDRIGAYFAGLRKDNQTDPQERFTVKTSPVPVLIQALPLGVTTCASARRAAGVMIDRLSPLAASDIVWDILGPVFSDEHHHTFLLAVVKQEDLQDWAAQNPDARMLEIKHEHGHFRFRTRAIINQNRRKVLYALLGGILLYTALLWALGQWAERPARIAGQWQEQLKMVKIETNVLKDTLARTEATILQIRDYQSGETGRGLQILLSALPGHLAKDGRLINITHENDQVRIQGFTDDPLKLAQALEALAPVERVQLGATAQDRTSGLQRFNLTLVMKQEQANE